MPTIFSTTQTRNHGNQEKPLSRQNNRICENATAVGPDTWTATPVLGRDDETVH